MGKIDIEVAFIYSKRSEIRDVVRQSLKANGLSSNNIFNLTEESEVLAAIGQNDFAYLILDWEIGPDSVLTVLDKNRQKSAVESHPTFLIAGKEDENIIKTASEFFVSAVVIGEVNTDTIRSQIKGIVAEYHRLSPIRQVLLNIENFKRSGNLDQAHETLEKLHQRSNNNPRVVIELADSFCQKGLWQEAEELLKPLLDSDPPNARIKHLYARCRLRKNDFDGAIASLQGAQILSPYNTERLLEMGDLFLGIDRINEANESFAEILKFAPDSKPAKLGQTKGLLLAGEVNEALTLLRECANKRDLSSVFNTAAIIAIKQKKFDVGFGLYRRAVSLLAKDSILSSRIIYNMGIGFVKTGKHSQGLACFKKSHDLDPSFKNASHNLNILSHSKAAENPVDLADFNTVDFDETVVHQTSAESEPVVENDKVPDLAKEPESIFEDLDLDSMFENVGSF